MTNPLRGVLLNGRFYDYIHTSFRRSTPLKNSVDTTQSSRTFSVQGKDSSSYTLTLQLSSVYNVRDGETVTGETTWKGLSRLTDLEDFLGAKGVSMPITFVNPYGLTLSVVPTGGLDITIFNEENPDATNGTEFRVSLTLEEI